MSQAQRSPLEAGWPCIGTDESGKGDYLGPLVVAGLCLDEQEARALSAQGVMDCKRLTDRRVRELAARIRKICGPDRFSEVILPPETYNRLYEEMKREGKNLNALLAWGHARAIENILQRTPCGLIVADQFGDERLIRSRLSKVFHDLNPRLIQRPRAEENLAVAGASILARDRFLAWMQEASERQALPLPRGASPAVVAAARALVEREGPDALRRVAKLHFRTTQEVLRESRARSVLQDGADIRNA